MPNTSVGLGNGMIGGVYRDGYAPHCLVTLERPSLSEFTLEIAEANRNGVGRFKLLRRYAYYGRNGGLTRDQRREAFQKGLRAA